MKKLLIVVITVVAFMNVQASDWVSVTSDQPAGADITLISSQITYSSVQFTLNGFWKDVVATDRGSAWRISLENGIPSLEQSAPDLPVFSTSLVVPDKAHMTVRVISSKYVEFTDVLIAPSKGNLTRDIDPSTVPYNFGAQYNKDVFYPAELAVINEPYIVRDVRGQALHFQPFRYNPVTGVLRVYYEVTIEVVEDGTSNINVLDRTGFPEKVNDEFRKIYQRQFLNYNASNRYDPVDEHGNMLIISYGDFMDEMEPFIEWKTMAGMPVEIVDVADIGNSAAIKQYISDYYDENGLTFVLLVGDAQQVPSSYSSGDSDVDYSYVVGNDHYPDLFVGRFSAQTEDQVVTQVQRTIDYEKNPIADDTDWYTHCIGVASNQGPGDDNEYDYQHIRNIGDNKLIPFTYDYAYEYFDGSQGGNDEDGNPNASDVAVGVNEGATVINYTGHGSTTSWGSSGFSNSNVNQLTNTGKLPFIISVACVNGNFVNSTCFAEAWLRAENDGEPTGAVATIMSTINQSWNPPMRGQDEMIDVLIGADENNVKRTFGGLTMNGCMGMNDAYGSQGDEMTDTWTIFGDPSLMVRTAVPVDLTVTHPEILFLGTSSLTITCNADDGLAALSMDGELIGSAFIEDGTATIEFDELMNIVTLDLVVTAFNFRPYIATIDVMPANGSYIVYSAYQINDDSLGNGNNSPEYNEYVFLSVTVENVGTEDASNVMATLSVNNEYVTILDNTESYGTVGADQTVDRENGFLIHLANNIPDQMNMEFDMLLRDSKDSTWLCNFSIPANAPDFILGEMTIDDAADGNGNGRLDPGETVTMIIEAKNGGHTAIGDVMASLQAFNPFITILSADTIFSMLNPQVPVYASYNVTVSETAPEGVFGGMWFQLTSGGYTKSRIYYSKIGTMVEDWETGNFSKFNWHFDGDADWRINASNPFEGICDVKSGEIGDEQTSEFYITYEVMSDDTVSFFKKVSSEPNYDFLEFYIDSDKIGSWSGTDDWTLEKFPVTEGEHTFRWVYAKDYSATGGSDCAWVDYIVLPVEMATSVYAGPDQEACSGAEYFQCDGIATNYDTISWATSGTGTFSDINILNPQYTLSEDDIQSGVVMLSLSLVDVDGNPASDTMTIIINAPPVSPVIPDGPSSVNLNEVSITEYTTEEVEGAGFYEWVLLPEEAGFTVGTSTTVQVFWNMEFEGEAGLSVAVKNECGTGDFSDELLINVTGTVGIESLDDEISVQIIPNPNNGRFRLVLGSDIAQDTRIELINQMGQIVYRKQLQKSDETININTDRLNSGMYYLIIYHGVKHQVEKVMIN